MGAPQDSGAEITRCVRAFRWMLEVKRGRRGNWSVRWITGLVGGRARARVRLDSGLGKG